MTIAQAQPTREGELLAGRYTLLQRLGGGGVGEVYRARDERLKRDVAVKLLRPEHNRSRDVVQRLLREAQVTDQVRHPNVVEVFDVDVDPSGVPFIVQELLRGEDLADHVGRKGGRLGVDEVLAYMVPVCEAVAAAHHAKVVHRDLKPENVFLMQTVSGIIPKVLDFGLARVVLAPGQARLTATGLTMGTPYFMSPEQVQGDRNIDARCDVWALGVMLYEMLSGRLPFDGDAEGAVYVKVCTVEPTPVEMLAPWISADLAKIVGRCLRKDVARRYPDASGVARDLLHVQKREAVEPTLTSAPLSTQMMRVVPVSLASPEPAAQPARPSAPGWKQLPPTAPSIGWSPSAAPPAPRRTPAWVFVVAAALVLLALGVGVGVTLVLSDDEREVSAPSSPQPFNPVVRPVAVPVAVPMAPPIAPMMQPSAPMMPPSAPMPNSDPTRAPVRNTDPDIDPKPRHTGVPSVPTGALGPFQLPIENGGQ